MKKIRVFVLLAAIAFASSYNVFACDSDGWFDSSNDWDHHDHKKGDRCNTVGVPLDGGLLAILAAAGATYFVSRKKKKSQE